jgi:hypothetical protein
MAAQTEVFDLNRRPETNALIQLSLKWPKKIDIGKRTSLRQSPHRISTSAQITDALIEILKDSAFWA